MKKNLKKIIIGIVGLALAYSLVWFVNSKIVYTPYTKEVPKHESGLYVLYDKKTNYIYNVKTPAFPSFTGNLGVSDNEGSGLIIWPGFFGKNYEYGARIKDGDLTYQIKLDKDMNLIDKDENLKEVYNRNKELIDDMYESAEKAWKIDFSEK
ncbi:TPA: hypothetical protein VA072_001285 [Streptococcus agalactiae]|nr:hypothetical protein [Streptococcus agalactiae]